MDDACEEVCNVFSAGLTLDVRLTVTSENSCDCSFIPFSEFNPSISVAGPVFDDPDNLEPDPVSKDPGTSVFAEEPVNGQKVVYTVRTLLTFDVYDRRPVVIGTFEHL